MGDVVNLNRYRKQKEREERARLAAENRNKHGQTKADRQRRGAQQKKDSARLDGHKLDHGPGGGDGVA